MEQLQAQKETEYYLLGNDFEEIKNELEKSPVDTEKLQVLQEYISLRLEEYWKVHRNYLELLTKSKDESGFKDEKETERKLMKLKVEIDFQCKKHLENKSEQSGGGGGTNADPYRLALPRRELATFDGDVRNWLSFWASFQEIHTDATIPELEKFNFLYNAMVPKSPAHEVVKSFPLLKKNYKKAVDRLKERFGRPSMLVKVYVRDLLRLVIDNSTGKGLEFVSLVTQLTSQIRNLESLGVTTDKCAAILYPVVESCLPDEVLQAWQRHSSHSENLSDIIDFLEEEVNNKTERALAQSFIKKKTAEVQPSASSGRKKSETATATAASLVAKDQPQKPMCVFCDKNHSSERCHAAMEMSAQQKREAVIKKGCCLACLKRGHAVSVCRNNSLMCHICRGKHLTIMCQVLRTGSAKKSKEAPDQHSQNDKREDGVPIPSEFQGSLNTPGSSRVMSAANQTRSPRVPLQVVIATAYGTNGKSRTIRAVMDPGSQRSFVTTELAKYLQLPKVGSENIVSDLFGGKQSAPFDTPVLKLLLSNVQGENMTLFNVNSIDTIISNTPPATNGIWVTDFLNRVDFKDLDSTSPVIDVLIGDDVAAKIFTGRIRHLSYGPSVMETRFGWALCGKLPIKPSSVGTLLVSTLLSPDRPLSELWDLEAIGIMDVATKQSREEIEQDALKHFNETTIINEEGRYEVELPFVSGTQNLLQSNYFIAERRLRNMMKNLKSQGLVATYDLILKQWEESNMIEVVDEDVEADGIHYLPHRAVIRTSSSTTPIRPVFDASAKAKGKYSLNDCLEKGPNLLELIPAILIRFRRYETGAVADIKKAFQMISVSKKHRNYLRFLWWQDESCTKLKIYRHTRVVFGVSSSPFLLGATLQLHLRKADDFHLETAKNLIDNMYVDNCVVSFNSKEEAKICQQQSQDLLKPVHFDLRGWEFGPSSEEKIVPVLGLLWNTGTDTLSVDQAISMEKASCESTQRQVLSLCHTLFDPLGFISPFILISKLILRKCHAAKLGWDTTLPQDLALEFKKWKDQFGDLRKINIPRHIFFNNENKSLHVFCDASSSAYAAVVFLRVEHNNKVKVQMLISKSRVAPQKQVSIPRLELTSCLIASRLMRTVVDALQVPDIPVTFWSDSSTALAWIAGDGPWSIFVQNRVLEIRQLTKMSQWFHVPGINNPADLPSRGCSAKKLADLRWWEGPEWLCSPSQLWPSEPYKFNLEEIEMEKKKTVSSLITKEENKFLTSLYKLSSFNRIVRAVAIYNLFCRHMIRKYLPDKAQTKEDNWILSSPELHEAENIVLKLVQDSLNEPDLKKLRYYKDDQGLWRISTRLIHDDTADFLNPIILPSDNEVVRLLIMQEHQNNFHGGVQYTLAALRQKYWILNGRRTVRRVIRDCAVCRRFIRKKLTVPEAPLPKMRTGELVPFSTTGVDMAGPLYLKNGTKVWIALFCCAMYRAIHIELTDTMSTEGFLQCLRRFVARRGRPHSIYSDNGLNFTGAATFLKKVDWKKIQKHSSVSQIRWIFNPPSAAWWGGWWERLISMIKQILRRILGKRIVDQEELSMLMVEVEEVINNRPLTPLSEDADELVALTPNHFVRNSGMAFLPEMDVRDRSSMKKAYKKLQHLRDALRSRFRLEYIGFLRQHHTNKAGAQLKPGDVVIVENELQKRLDWPLAIVEEAIPGRDGRVRTYRVRTKNGILIRPAQRLIPMEIV